MHALHLCMLWFNRVALNAVVVLLLDTDPTQDPENRVPGQMRNRTRSR